VLNIWWYWSHRRGFPLHIDESGYTAFAIEHTHALRHDGLIGLVRSAEEHSVHAPLVPLLTVPLELVFGEHIGNGFVVVDAFYALLVVLTYVLARQLVQPWLAALSALVVATAPDVLTFTRAYFFAVPAAAIFAAAICCVLRSDGMRRIGWALAGGALLGLALLTRTMMLALAAAPLVAALVQGLARGGELRRRLLTFGAAVVAAAAVASAWYARNVGDAVGFLTGTRFRGPVTGHGPDWHLGGRDIRELVSSVQLPLGLLLTGVAMAALVVALRSHRSQRSRRQELRRLLRTDTAVLVLVVLEGVAAFSVADTSLGQWLPLVPVMITLAVLALASLPRASVRTTLAWVVLTLSVVNLAMLSDVWPSLGEPRMVSAAAIGDLPVTDGRVYVDRFFPDLGNSGRPGRFPDSWRHWPRWHRRLTDWMKRFAAEHGQQAVVVMGGNESRLLNLNDVLMSDRLSDDEQTVIVGRVFVERDTSRRTIRRYLDDPQFGVPNFVITFDPPSRDAPEDRVKRVLRDRGYRVMQTVSVPDGTVRVWWRSQADAPSARAVAHQDSSVGRGERTASSVSSICGSAVPATPGSCYAVAVLVGGTAS